MKKKVIVISFSNLISQILNLINYNDVDIAVLVSTDIQGSAGSLQQYRQYIKKYVDFNSLKECLAETYYDYIMIAGFNEEVVNLCLEYGVEKEQIIDLRIFADPVLNRETFSLLNAIKYLSTATSEINTVITGLSYAYDGIDLSLFTKSAFNLAAPGSDLFYDYHVIKYILDKRGKCFNNIIIGLAPYSFQYDLSQTIQSYRIYTYYPLLKNTHNFFVKDDILNSIFNNSYLSLFDKINNKLLFDPNDRIGRKPSNNYALPLYRKIIARKTAGEWDNKNYPATVQENIQLLDNYFKLCGFYNIRPIVVVFPTNKLNWIHFPNKIFEQYNYLIEEFKERYQFEYCDLFKSEQFTDTDFYDITHLNIKGSKKVTSILTETFSL